MLQRILINEAARNPFAYYSIKWITGFQKSYLVKMMPRFLLRGFIKKERIFLKLPVYPVFRSIGSDLQAPDHSQK